MAQTPTPSKSWLDDLFKELVQPFIDVIRAPRALWGINLAYLLEGMVYFGILGYLTIYFSETVFAGVPQPDVLSHDMVMVQTAGITISMFFLGFVPDKWGVRRALLIAFCLMLLGRVAISAGPTVLGLSAGLWSPLHLVTMAGILLVVVGYGMYQPAAYAAVRQFSTPKTAAMGFAMLYALMNLGGWFPTFAFLIRDDDYLGLGIPGTFWVYTSFTVVALVATVLLLTGSTVKKAIEDAKAETARLEAEKSEAEKAEKKAAEEKAATAAAAAMADPRVPMHIWLVVVAVLVALFFRVAAPWNYVSMGVTVLLPGIVAVLPEGPRKKVVRFIATHPLADPKFFFFIFALIPVQTLFTYNWLVLPPYINRAFEGWIGEYFEIAANANPLLIFVAVPVIAALTRKTRVYTMMVVGTAVMASAPFFLIIGPHAWTLGIYIVLLTLGEAIWQPRFLQYAAEIAPEGRTGQYMGVAQLPWFLTKMLVPLLYSGIMMDKYCPAEGPRNTELMWFIFSIIAVLSPAALLAAKGWIGKDMKAASA